MAPHLRSQFGNNRCCLSLVYLFRGDFRRSCQLMTAIVDHELSGLGDLGELTMLSLENTASSNDGLAEVATHQPTLQTLFLSGTKLTDDGLKQLARMQNLSRLDLASCDIHDSGMEHLQSLPSLRAVGLRSTRVSDTGLYDLIEALRHNAVIQGPNFSLLGGKQFDIPL